MRSRRHLIAPAVLVGAVAAGSVVLFGGSARAANPAAADTSTTTTAPNGSTTSTVNAPGAAGSPYNYTPSTVATGVPLPSTNRNLSDGRQLFVQACSSCHGTRAEGTVRAPTLTGLGAATVDFWVSTGRMPLEVPTAQAVRKVPVFDARQARAIADYVASLAPGGPNIPSVDTSSADLQRGGSMFRLNCATCHSYLAVGGALDYGAFAPSLAPDSNTQIAEAIRTGPGNMPRFGPKNLTDQDVNDIVKYVRYITKPDDKGGFDLAHIGPVAEGLVGFVFGVGLLMIAAFWIGDRA